MSGEVQRIYWEYSQFIIDIDSVVSTVVESLIDGVQLFQVVKRVPVKLWLEPELP